MPALEDHQSVRFRHVPGHLRKQPIRSKPNGTAQSPAYGSQFRLDCVGDLHSPLQPAFAAHELTRELVTRHHLLDRDAPLDGCGDAMVIFNVESRTSLHGD
jgi:hypothetical protein